MRKLVTVQRVKELLPITGADRIELAVVLGWGVVVKKGEYKVDDLVLYCEIDSWIPHSIAPFLSGDKEPKEFEGVKGQRLKTVKLRKTLSQGLLLPLSTVTNLTTEMFHDGDDVTELLGVLKWESPEEQKSNGTRAQGYGRMFPGFIQKTDQQRVQNIGALVEKALDEEFEISIKKDGSSLTVFSVDPSSPYYDKARGMADKKQPFLKKLTNWLFGYLKGKSPVYGICSRNILLSFDGDSNFHKAVKKYNLLGCLDAMQGSFALQGELVAPDIQGNYEKVKDVEFHLFDIFDIDKQKYVLPQDRVSYAISVDIPHATVVAQGKLRDILRIKDGEDIVKACLDYAEGPSDTPGVKREGVVMKSLTRDFSFKCVANSYLLATGK